MTSVLLGANSVAARNALESVLAKNDAFQIVGSFSINKALAQLDDLQPDVLLLDVDFALDESVLLPIKSGDAPAHPALVILTDDSDKLLTAEALGSGVRAILPRTAKPEEIFAALQASFAGLVVLHSDAVGSLLSAINAEGQSELDPFDQILTRREIAVLRMLAEGLVNKEIATKLSISDHTVKFHISSIFAKLGASNRTEAVTLGIRHGLIML